MDNELGGLAERYIPTREDLLVREKNYKIWEMEQQRRTETFSEKHDRLESLQEQRTLDVERLGIQIANLSESQKKLKESLDSVVNGMPAGEEHIPVDDTSVEKIQKELQLISEALNYAVRIRDFYAESVDGLKYRLSAMEELGVDLFERVSTDQLSHTEARERTVEIYRLQSKYLCLKDLDGFLAMYTEILERPDELMYTEHVPGSRQKLIKEFKDRQSIILVLLKDQNIEQFLDEVHTAFPDAPRESMTMVLQNREPALKRLPVSGDGFFGTQEYVEQHNQTLEDYLRGYKEFTENPDVYERIHSRLGPLKDYKIPTKTYLQLRHHIPFKPYNEISNSARWADDPERIVSQYE